MAELTLRGMIAPFVLDGPINRLSFQTYVEKVLVPELRTGDIVICQRRIKIRPRGGAKDCHSG